MTELDREINLDNLIKGLDNEIMKNEESIQHLELTNARVLYYFNFSLKFWRKKMNTNSIKLQKKQIKL